MSSVPPALDPECLEFVRKHLNPVVQVNLTRLDVASLDERSLLYLMTALLLEAHFQRRSEVRVLSPSGTSRGRLFCSFTALTSAFGFAILAFSGLSLALYLGFSLAHKHPAPSPKNVTESHHSSLSLLAIHSNRG
jgi:hypothetical protein